MPSPLHVRKKGQLVSRLPAGLTSCLAQPSCSHSPPHAHTRPPRPFRLGPSPKTKPARHEAAEGWGAPTTQLLLPPRAALPHSEPSRALPEAPERRAPRRSGRRRRWCVSRHRARLGDGAASPPPQQNTLTWHASAQSSTAQAPRTSRHSRSEEARAQLMTHADSSGAAATTDGAAVGARL